MEGIRDVPLSNLRLDVKNPRIHQAVSENISQLELAKFIYDEFGISDLKDSILKNGYFPVEPLVVIPVKDKDDYYTVVEGNRRLTTLKILCEQECRDYCVNEAMRGDYIATDKLVQQKDKIPVVIADSRESVKAYLGVRHLGGVKKWEPLAQSKYVYNQIILQKEDTKEKAVQLSIDKFIKETNNERGAVLNFFYKYCIYKHMQELIAGDKTLKEAKSALENKFSLLEVAFGKSGTSTVAKYIGIESYKKLNAENYEDIIDEENNQKVKNLIKWVFMPNSEIRESRQINTHLKKILRKKTSTKAFEKGATKEEALLLSNSARDIILSSCKKVHKSLTNIQNNWTNTKIEDREELKEHYRYEVIDKVEKTNNTLDI